MVDTFTVNFFRIALEHYPNMSEHEEEYQEDEETNTGNSTTGDKYCNFLQKQHPDAILALKINLHISLFLVTVGLLGNFMNVLVMFKSMRKHTSSIYIVVLALSDSTFLILEFIISLLPVLGCYHFSYPLNFRIINNAVSCKVVMFLYNLAANYSSLLILCFTVERFIAVYKPMKVKQLCTMKRTRVTCVVSLITISLCVLPYNFLMIGLDSSLRRCTVNPKWISSHSAINVAELTLFRVVPVFVIAVMNIFIIYKVVRHVPMSAELARRDWNKKSRQLTVILILISTSYIVLCVPDLITAVYWSVLVSKDKVATHSREFWILYKSTQTLYTAAFAINFYLYVLGSRMYRQIMKITYLSIRRSLRSSSEGRQ